MRRISVLVALLTTFISCFITTPAFTLENTHARFTFDESGKLIHLVNKASNEDTVKTVDSGRLPWELVFVDITGELAVSSYGNVTSRSLNTVEAQTLILSWNNVTLRNSASRVAVVDIHLEVKLPHDTAISSWTTSFQVVSSHTAIGIWQCSLALPFALGSSSDGSLFYPGGFGLLFSNPTTTDTHSATYPGGPATMQFMSLSAASSSTGVYFSSLDGSGAMKVIQYTSMNDAKHPMQKISLLEIVSYPANAGKEIPAGETWTMPYAIAVGVFSVSSSQPMWYEAASIYRTWALEHTAWMAQGPLRNQPSLPAWYRNNHLWLNTHWQCHDIFNETGGDPAFVVDYTLQVAEHLNVSSLALHWYEWQQGPDPAPEARYKFDTHYPDYFPPRSDFYSAVQTLTKNNIYVFPYINGRIFDVASDSYLEDDGDLYCSKKTRPHVITSDSMLLESYVESYGSEATFCVASPYTAYWQNKVAEVVDELVNVWQVPGVYIDQLASAKPVLCWDAKHGHTLGGGDFWREGCASMMDAIATTYPPHRSPPMVTEDNSEPFMDMVQGYLTLTPFKYSLAQSSIGDLQSYQRLVPAFPAIYGGYYIGFGSEWFRADFEDHDWWCSKLATTFAAGSQIGWFSLIGMIDDPEETCGPMGVGDLLLSESNADLVHFMQMIVSARAVVVDYLVDGRIFRPLMMSPEPLAKSQTVPSGGQPILDYDSVVSATWTLDGNVLALLIGTTEATFETEITIPFELWGFSGNAMVDVFALSGEGKSKIATLTGPTAVVSVSVLPRSISMLEFVQV